MTVGAGLSINATEQNQQVQNRFMQQLAQGRSNAVGSFTVASNTTSMTVTAPTCMLSSVVLLAPTDSNSAADMGLIYPTAGNAQFTVNFSSNGLSRTFLYAVIG